MSEYQMTKEELQLIIERLQDAINVCHRAPENEEEGYPYATGYSRSCMIAIMEMLQDLKNDD